jgi:hypothetical protein
VACQTLNKLEVKFLQQQVCQTCGKQAVKNFTTTGLSNSQQLHVKFTANGAIKLRQTRDKFALKIL